MRLPTGQKCRVVLEDGTTIAGTAARSWQWGVLKLTGVLVYARAGEVTPPPLSYILVARRRAVFAQVGAE